MATAADLIGEVFNIEEKNLSDDGRGKLLRAHQALAKRLS